MAHNFDVFIIGGGSGGVRCARILAQHGKKVAIAESKHWGGVCVNLGCVPKKLFVYASHYGRIIEDAKGYGWETSTNFNWQQLIQNKNQEIARLNKIYQNILAKNGVEMFEGEASFLGKNHLKVGKEEVTAKHIIIASGSSPKTPQISGGENALVSDDMFYLSKLPKRLVVVGGGYIALEFASIMSGLGVEVSLVHRGEKALRGFDEDVRDFAAKALAQNNIKMIMNTTINSLEKSDHKITATTNQKDKIEAEAFLYAIGREPNIKGLNLENGTIVTANGAVRVNGELQTSNPSVFAIGDVKGEPQLTPVAIAEGHYLALKLLGENPLPINYSLIPTAVFMQPTVASVGVVEEQKKHRAYKTEFTPMHNILPKRAEKMFVKIVVEKATNRIVGIHLVGDDAAEIIQSLTPALEMGITATKLRHSMPLHPTLAEEVITLLPK